MNVSVSNAELKVQDMLNLVGFYSESQRTFCLLHTKPDFYFHDVNLAVYLDGEQVHKHSERDEELRRLLKKRHGCKILAYSYKAPLTMEDIIDNVKGYRRNQNNG